MRMQPAVEMPGESPFMVEFFLVQGIGFKCMAYPDEEGKWHEAFFNTELPGPIHVLE